MKNTGLPDHGEFMEVEVNRENPDRPVSTSRTQDLKPEQLIPLDDDDFTEF